MSLIINPYRFAAAAPATNQYARFPGSGGTLSMPDAAALDITGDLEAWIHVALDDWTPISQQTLWAKYTTTSNQRSYRLVITSTGKLAFTWTAAGTTASNATTTAGIFAVDGAALWVGVTVDADDGTSHGVVTYYTSTAGPGSVPTTGTATLLDTVTTSNVVAIFAGTAPLELGGINSGNAERIVGNVRRFILRSGIGGTIVADFDANLSASGGYTDTVGSAGGTWTVTSPVAITSA